MVEIDYRLLKEITDYCNLNNMSDIDKEINRMLRCGFNIEKYGMSPFEIPRKQEVAPKEDETVKEAPKVNIEVQKEEEVKPKRGRPRKKKEEPKEEETKPSIKEEPIKDDEPKKVVKRKVRIIKG